jgi:hypothetical protein
MHLTGAFFANVAREVNGMLEVGGGCWSSTTVQQGSAGFVTQLVVLADIVLPIEPAGGPHVYNVRIQGQHNRIVLPFR